jgi:homoserine kinase type II
MIKENMLTEILSLWRIPLQSARPDISIAGSPDRCLSRIVVEDSSGKLYIVEKLPLSSNERKTKISRALAFLAKKETPAIVPYLPYESESCIAQYSGFCWQILPFVPGVPLTRPAYVEDAWRGKEAADFLNTTKKTSLDIGEDIASDCSSPFSIAAFIKDLAGKLKTDKPSLFGKVTPALDYLHSGFMSSHDELPVQFCHGDFHPLNIIWSDTKIRAVIDWEFCGIKPELYDATNMMGCLGMEIPKALQGGFAFAFMDRLKELDYFQPLSRRYFFDFVLALRFAWLSEWLHVSDPEMADLEAVYINLLLDNRGILSRSWGFPVRN